MACANFAYCFQCANEEAFGTTAHILARDRPIAHDPSVLSNQLA